MTDQAQPSIIARLTAAIGSTGTLAKDRRNEHGRYDYLSEEAVKQAAAKACAAHGITPQAIRFEIIESADVPAKQGTAHRVTMRCTLSWGADVWCEGFGCGVDYGDKAVMKAQTAAIREAWKNRLCIATGADPEADDTHDREHELRAVVAQAPAHKPAAPAPRAAAPAAPAPAPASAPRVPAPAQRAPDGSPPKHEVVPFGRNKGRHISEVDDRDIEYLITACERTLADPDKARFHDLEQRRLDALMAERAHRLDPQQGGYSDPQPEPAQDDDIPF